MAKNTPAPSSGTHNVITSGTKVIGQIIAEEDLRIDGVIEGNIDCKGKIIIGPASAVTGDVACTSLELMGKVVGDVSCTETIVLRKASQLVGDIKTNSIEIEPGATFTGACSMKNS